RDIGGAKQKFNENWFIEYKDLLEYSIEKDAIFCLYCYLLDQILENKEADIDGDYFAILIDESRDVSIKEQMVIAVRYVNKKTEIIERLIGIVHLSDTTTLSLKRALNSLFMKYNLTISRVREQGYDGASNMRGEFNGLKMLIMKKNNSAFYINYFAH
uniref:DUF4371 domain-containing protein n=1 Tax=Kalanchoe fedtschenkoi TaxID=63787 RepID=A0A7N0VHQ5_KALFE